KIRSVGGNVFGKIQAIIRRTTSTKNATDQEKKDNGDMGRRCARLLNVSLNKGIKDDSLFMATRSPFTRSRSLLPISAAKDTKSPFAVAPDSFNKFDAMTTRSPLTVPENVALLPINTRSPLIVPLISPVLPSNTTLPSTASPAPSA